MELNVKGMRHEESAIFNVVEAVQVFDCRGDGQPDNFHQSGADNALDAESDNRPGAWVF